MCQFMTEKQTEYYLLGEFQGDQWTSAVIFYVAMTVQWQTLQNAKVCARGDDDDILKLEYGPVT
jgi:hypothetical protein